MEGVERAWVEEDGGEWVFRGGRCVCVHRMRDVGDHLTAGKFWGLWSVVSLGRAVRGRG